jgi:hypothetical protein
MSTEEDNTGSDGVEATQTDTVNTGALGTLVAVGLFAMISIATAVAALVRHDVEEEEASKDADSNAVVVALKNSQRGVLNGPAGYVDRGKGLVSLPIDLAKQLVVSELEHDPSSATPPEAANTGVTAATSAAPGSAASAAPAGAGQKKPKETGKSEGAKKGAGAKPETVKEHGTVAPGQPAPATSMQPSSPPLTPTAASPGAKAPGPLKN